MPGRFGGISESPAASTAASLGKAALPFANCAHRLVLCAATFSMSGAHGMLRGAGVGSAQFAWSACKPIPAASKENRELTQPYPRQRGSGQPSPGARALCL